MVCWAERGLDTLGRFSSLPEIPKITGHVRQNVFLFSKISKNFKYIFIISLADVRQTFQKFLCSLNFLPFFVRDNFFDFLFVALLTQVLSEKMSTIKGKNLLPLGTYSIALDKIFFFSVRSINIFLISS